MAHENQNSKTLNPLAPEYIPISISGITPSLPPLQPPSFLPPHQFHTYSAAPQSQAFYPAPLPPHQFRPYYTHNPAPPPPRSTWGRRERRREQFSQRDVRNAESKHQIVPLTRDEEATTVMIKNIPYNCRRKELITMLDDFCKNQNARNETQETPSPCAYDYLYLPIDFWTRKSRGYAFVNFTTSRAAWEFHDCVHLTYWGFHHRPNWQKKIEIVCAEIQGKEDAVSHFSESVFECETDEYLPVCFSPARDGSGYPAELIVIGKRLPVVERQSYINHN
ncbi:protein terminal ear1-like [Salvia hispanica]|uniref:protein terminal ear1-like n=1 Tax=Salvia hispanica TaxID=49212 RepID=UPI0020098123|nr:protein terminal ear1-like [Salvia hispanica]